ncbi:MAG TPA: PEP-utilizing enzyme [Baekduia sp.]|nr:PEP-utilizing enzyme [Baekduia sp.]
MTDGPILDGDWDPQAWWTTTNFGEAIPGVLTPLNWSFWGVPGERAARRAFAMLGAMSEAETHVPEDPHRRAFGIFHGRFAAKVDFLGELGDRLPGTSGPAVAEQVLGHLPPDFRSQGTLRRLPAIARRLPVLFVTLPRRIAATHATTAAWWAAEVERAPALGLDDARRQFAQAAERFEDVMALHVACLFAGVQLVFDQVAKLAAAAGDPGLAARLMAGQGSHAELALVEDLWSLSRGRLELDAFLARHGYHGPAEGELSSRMWREAPEPVLAVVAQYRAKPDDESPAAVGAQRAAGRRQARAELLSRLPRHRRPAARLVLALADRYLPLRGVGKVSFLQSLDVARAAARRVGEHLAAAGVLDDAEDVFLLTTHELQTVPDGTWDPAVLAQRRAEREACAELVLPTAWRGRPEPLPAPAPAGDRRTIALEGIGASPGVVEGPVRVLLDPDFEDVEPGEILVAPTTDPSWASIMFTSAALVVDLGGQLSHAAVVARELAIPCVMGTGDGTRRLRTGDICRVDGHAGTVHVLQAAVEAPA